MTSIVRKLLCIAVIMAMVLGTGVVNFSNFAYADETADNQVVSEQVDGEAVVGEADEEIANDDEAAGDEGTAVEEEVAIDEEVATVAEEAMSALEPTKPDGSNYPTLANMSQYSYIVLGNMNTNNHSRGSLFVGGTLTGTGSVDDGSVKGVASGSYSMIYDNQTSMSFLGRTPQQSTEAYIQISANDVNGAKGYWSWENISGLLPSGDSNYKYIRPDSDGFADMNAFGSNPNGVASGGCQGGSGDECHSSYPMTYYTDATSVYTRGIAGNIIAPNATVTVQWCNFHGTIVAKNVVVDGAEAHINYKEQPEPDKTSVSGQKTWNDENNKDNTRPEYIVVNLLADGKKVDSMRVYPDNNGDWKYSFNNLPKTKDGNKIVYTVTETPVDKYDATITGYDITNDYNPIRPFGDITISVEKKWVDGNTQGVRPTEVTVELYKQIGDGPVEDTGLSIELNEQNGWTDGFNYLPEYADEAKTIKIKYSLVEVDVPDIYESVITPGIVENSYVITNTELTEVAGTKTWEDYDNKQGLRPEQITVRLFEGVGDDATQCDKQIVEPDADGNWKYVFPNLPKYKLDASGNPVEIKYSVKEDVVKGYTPTYSLEGYDITNSQDPTEISIDVTKKWVGDEDKADYRPDYVIMQLYADGQKVDGKTLTLDASNDWTGKFENLLEYKEGVKINYTIKELEVRGYISAITGNADEGFTVTNTLEKKEFVEVSGAKTWNDNEDEDGIRPDSITINLLANGKVTDKTKTTEADEWTYSFDNLPKYDENGVEIKYTIAEVVPDGYTVEYDGYDLTNTHEPNTPPDNPKTGDNMPIIPLALIALAALAGIILTTRRRTN